MRSIWECKPLEPQLLFPIENLRCGGLWWIAGTQLLRLICHGKLSCMVQQDIRLVGPAVWRRALKHVLVHMPSTDRRLTLAIVSALQSREVGITPKIAGSLARVIVSKGNYLEVPWTNVIYRLQETVKELAGVVLPSDRFAAT